jgi:two-component system CheB/CheR fusion protein
LLVRELNHRVKNLFTITDGVISLSARSAKTPDDLMKKIRSRLSALALAHELIMPNLTRGPDGKPQPTSLDILLRKILSPYDDTSGAQENYRVVSSGPAVEVGAHAVTNLALILHEFATNAAKYGALSVPQGRVEITWELSEGMLVLSWEERDGPPLVASPTSEGFGTVLSGHVVRDQFCGSLGYSWHPHGLVINLSFAVDRLRD